MEIDKKLADKVLDTAGKVIVKAVDAGFPNLGSGVAGGALGTAVFKSGAVKGLPLVGKMAAAGLGTAVGSGGSYLGVEDAKAIAKNSEISSMIKNSPHSDPNHDRIPSPDNEFIKSVVEELSPLEKLLSIQILMNLLLLILFILLFIMLFYKFIFFKNIDFLNSICDKIKNEKIKEGLKRRIEISKNYEEKFNLIIRVRTRTRLYL